jgi:hypothetical protein
MHDTKRKVEAEKAAGREAARRAAERHAEREFLKEMVGRIDLAALEAEAVWEAARLLAARK